ncbi:cytochrome P450 [Rhizoctonia solani]|nr:cytochrome P450 [Rhizoctonia solani]
MVSWNSLGMKEAVVAASIAAGVAYSLKSKSDFSKKRLPGPKCLPFIGHMLSVPRSSEHLAFAAMSKQLNTLNAMGQTIVVLKSAESASELLDKWSSVYSGRAQIPKFSNKDMMDWGQGIVFLNNNDRWRRDRRMLHEALHKGVVPRYYPAQEKQVQVLVRRLLNTPPTLDTPGDITGSNSYGRTEKARAGYNHPTTTLQAFIQKLSFAFGATLLHSTYGYLPSSPDDDWIVAASATTEHIAQAAQPTNFIVNFIHALRYLPDWFPGTGWKQTLRTWREHKEYITAAPYNWTKEQIKWNSRPSIVQNVLSVFPDHTPDTEDDVHIKLMSSTMFGVSTETYTRGLDTSLAKASFFILAMVLYPEVALKIQEEADRGNAERFPTVHDREQMPYVRSTLLEVIRWQPVNPLAIPHAAMEDDEYQGYHILIGSIVMGNTWAISRDESIYPDPECFNPDRFLDSKVPSSPAFGYGRRICPGSHFAGANLFL